MSTSSPRQKAISILSSATLMIFGALQLAMICTTSLGTTLQSSTHWSSRWRTSTRWWRVVRHLHGNFPRTTRSWTRSTVNFCTAQRVGSPQERGVMGAQKEGLIHACLGVRTLFLSLALVPRGCEAWWKRFFHGITAMEAARPSLMIRRKEIGMFRKVKDNFGALPCFLVNAALDLFHWNEQHQGTQLVDQEKLLI